MDDADLGRGLGEAWELVFGFHGADVAVWGDALADEVVVEGGYGACDGDFGGSSGS